MSLPELNPSGRSIPYCHCETRATCIRTGAWIESGSGKVKRSGANDPTMRGHHVPLIVLGLVEMGREP